MYPRPHNHSHLKLNYEKKVVNKVVKCKKSMSVIDDAYKIKTPVYNMTNNNMLIYFLLCTNVVI